MRIPGRIDRALDRQTKLLLSLADEFEELQRLIENLGVDIEFEDSFLNSETMRCPYDFAYSVRKAILKKQECCQNCNECLED